MNDKNYILLVDYSKEEIQNIIEEYSHIFRGYYIIDSYEMGKSMIFFVSTKTEDSLIKVIEDLELKYTFLLKEDDDFKSNYPDVDDSLFMLNMSLN